jgi:membrane-bound lytic murein transglycosylase D
VIRRFPTYSATLLACCTTLAGCAILPGGNANRRHAPSADTATPIPDIHATAPVVNWDDIVVHTPAPPETLWAHLRHGFSLPKVHNTRVKGELNWYTAHLDYLERVAKRARPYLYFIVKQIEARHMPLDLALLPIVESAYDPYAYSNGRAAGLWQFIPGTGKRFHLKQDWWYDGRRDVVASTNAALDYLQYLHNRFDGNWLLALAAYNSGGGTVARALAVNRRRHQPLDFWHLGLSAQTRAYVPRLLALRDLFAAPKHYGFKLPPIPDTPYLAKVNIHGQIALSKAASLTGISLKQMYLLNPGFNRWATDPDGPNELLVPVDKKDQLKAALAKLPPGGRVQWARHRIRHGETLGSIAHHYDTTVTMLEQVNNLPNSLIRAGHYLMIPSTQHKLPPHVLNANRRVATVEHRRAAGKLHHRVRPGESLWGIAHRYGVSVSELARWNGMSTHSTLRAGRKLVIWRGSAAVHIAHAGPSSSNKTHRTIVYTVHRGDSLSRISNRFNVSVDELETWNAIAASDYLQPGEQLKLYVDVTDQSSG